MVKSPIRTDQVDRSPLTPLSMDDLEAYLNGQPFVLYSVVMVGAAVFSVRGWNYQPQHLCVSGILNR